MPEFAHLSTAVASQFPGISDRERFQEVLRALVNTLVSGLIEGTIQSVQTAAVEDYEQVRAHPRRLASLTSAAAASNRALKQFLHHTVYYSEPMTEARKLSAAKIAELFEFYVAHPSRLPENYAASAADSPMHRVVCDYIAGMTDGYFLRCYEQALEKNAGAVGKRVAAK